MSWKENILVELVIQTGDEKEYRPKGWLNASYDKKFNLSLFEFPNTPGTYVRKTQPKGRVFNFEVYFQGHDHLVDSKAFSESSDDIRHWHVLHPYYGNLRVQPDGLRFDNSKENITKITGKLLETILGDLPRGNSSYKDVIAARKEASDIVLAGTYESANPNPSAADELKLGADFTIVTKDTNRLITLEEETNKYNELFTKANSSITNFTAAPLKAMRDIQSTLNYPIVLDQSIDARVNLLTTQFNSTLNTILNFPVEELLISQKSYFETIAGTLLSAIALILGSSNDSEDYGSRKNVLSKIDKLIVINNQYIETLDLIQSGDGTQLDSYLPDPIALGQLNSIVDFTVSNLFEIAFSAKQEREFILEKDSNLIVLAHRLYGEDSTDGNIDELIRNNNYGIKQHLLIKSGTIVKYFV